MEDDGNPRGRRALWIAAWAVVAWAMLGWGEVEHRWCPKCWAELEVDRIAIFGVPAFPVRTAVVAPCPEPVARFLPPDHVHELGIRRGYARHHGVLAWALGDSFCKLQFPSTRSEFAATLGGDPAFADFLDAKVLAGGLTVTDVRRLLAVPNFRQRRETAQASGDDGVDPAVRALGAGLYSEYTGRPFEGDDFWNCFGLPLEEPHFIPWDDR